MLVSGNRVRTAADFKKTVRRGRRFSSENAVLYVVDSDSPKGTRFGFIVSKAVGNAVVRNTMRRRLRSIAAESLVEHRHGAAHLRGAAVVVRMLPGSTGLSWGALRSEISAQLARALASR